MPGKGNPQVDGFIRKNKAWHGVLTELRRVALDCDLTEDVKWRVPAYTFDGNNVLLFVVLKEYVGLSFPKGALLSDPKKILVMPGENTRAARFVRFTEAGQVTKLEPVLRQYIAEAIDVERRGLRVDFKENANLPVPEEVQQYLNEAPELRAAFAALTPGRRRGYLLHFNAAKQSKTRVARLEKCAERIMSGKGLND